MWKTKTLGHLFSKKKSSWSPHLATTPVDKTGLTQNKMYKFTSFSQKNSLRIVLHGLELGN